MLSHIDKKNQPTMVDVGGKKETHRTAHAMAVVHLPEPVRAIIRDGDISTPKGPVFQTAIIAGTLAAKKTYELIPFCHPIGLDGCKINIELADDGRAVIDCRTNVVHKTGIEMEALTGASVAALTIYDMCKALSHDIVIGEIRLISKTGGKSDYASPA
ncbi:MAG TPA: cyclic pyranopterin monophosphate synthase MoaC [Gammaproteobacteria bacterium]|jgi:cyclic pyranopterin phosphate synthase|nr:cyclic pyranopterin monophosphate synthase MoaC [Chromatiales bacterium]MCP4926946.1 cyclic pyranopterin monophosphate synthase MoaC [Gammaproteobacteria bacterium]MDP7296336.1 cyclic pyranopterin monophosphate synthase MoaC [Gammaproteobacteria bacterium]MDP7660434.1 cyclic pyranopterin monophosphate synthase MoaC [Gammaproteobacteria bacterium]HJP39833.1 cyclic pyranopterin monophosphate synthase MoaC [Gammaproteobacteria bacterium]